MSRAISEDDRRNDEPGLPAELARNVRGKSRLHVEAAEQLLGIDERSLDLDHEDDPLCGMVGEQVESAAVTVPIEADFASDDPPEPLQPSRPHGGQRGVVGVQQPVDVLPLPADVPIERQVDSCGDHPSRADRQPAHVSAFHEGARGRSHAGRLCQVDQPPPTAVTPSANCLAESAVIHGSMMPMPDYPALTPALHSVT